MNGYGHFVPALIWSTLYWLWLHVQRPRRPLHRTRPRGAEEGWASRFRLARQRLPRPPSRGIFFFLLITVGSGAGSSTTPTSSTPSSTPSKAAKDPGRLRARLQEVRASAMPKIIAVDTNIDIFPERRSFSGTGHYVLQNKTNAPDLADPHLRRPRRRLRLHRSSAVGLSNVHFDRPFHVVSTSPRGIYTIYQFETPLAPGEKLDMTFNVAHIPTASKMATSARVRLLRHLLRQRLLPQHRLRQRRRTRRPAPPPRRAARRTRTPPPSRRPTGLPHQPLHPRPTGSATAPPSAPPTPTPKASRRSPSPPATSRSRLAPGRPPLLHLRHGQIKTPWRLLQLYNSARYDVKREVLPGQSTARSTSRSTTSPPTTSTCTT